MNIVRTLGIFLALAALSFILGFFVLAKLVPGSVKPAMAANVNPVSPAADSEVTHTPTPAPSRTETARFNSHRQSPVEPPVTVPGPSLDPVNDPPKAAKPTGVQAPRSVDAPAAQSARATAAPRDEQAASADSVAHAEPRPIVATRSRRRHRPAPKVEQTDNGTGNGDETTVAGSDAETDMASEPPVVRPRRARRLRPSREDTATVGTDSMTQDRPARTRSSDAEPGTRAVYRVHLGAFRSRDAADHEVERARARGFETQVVPVTRNGRTLYRVQAGAFREKDRAETVKQSLEDASLDATVSEQHR